MTLDYYWIVRRSCGIFAIKSKSGIPSGSYPHGTNRTIKIVKLQIPMWKSNCKNFFNFSLLPMARLNCYNSIIRVLFHLSFSFLPQFFKKVFHQRTAFFFQHTYFQFYLMVEFFHLQ